MFLTNPLHPFVNRDDDEGRIDAIPHIEQVGSSDSAESSSTGTSTSTSSHTSSNTNTDLNSNSIISSNTSHTTLEDMHGNSNNNRNAETGFYTVNEQTLVVSPSKTTSNNVLLKKYGDSPEKGMLHPLRQVKHGMYHEASNAGLQLAVANASATIEKAVVVTNATIGKTVFETKESIGKAIVEASTTVDKTVVETKTTVEEAVVVESKATIHTSVNKFLFVSLSIATMACSQSGILSSVTELLFILFPVALFFLFPKEVIAHF